MITNNSAHTLSFAKRNHCIRHLNNVSKYYDIPLDITKHYLVMEVKMPKIDSIDKAISPIKYHSK